MITLGIMQGRLSAPLNNKIQSFPKLSWRDEFYKASQAGLSSIEWIFEADAAEKNPISEDEGIKEINEIIAESGVSIKSICADYFMDIPYISASHSMKKELEDKLEWLVSRAHSVGANFIDIPFVDNSKINSESEFPLVNNFLKKAAALAKKRNIILALETSLNPVQFRKLLEMVEDLNVFANYDTGNSSGIGFNCVDEINTYSKFIKTIHIKDRKLRGTTVSLGTGNADFEKFFFELGKINFSGPIILQAARETEGKEVETAIKNRDFVRNHLNKYGIE